ncbi:MAG: glycoside hydrolase family 43 protein [Deltaproteobacteria bacterium]|nr:glycoside hydrolase family 43 protein [Deltaproteobacteria bacterium]
MWDTDSLTDTTSNADTDTQPRYESFDVTNPLILERADPWMYRHTDGFYYFIATEPDYARIYLRRAETVQGLADAMEQQIWTRHSSGEMGAHIWAPEIHFIDNAWYIYFAAGSTDNIWAIRIYVLENTAANPLTGTWTEKGRIPTAWESFSLDATTFEHNGTRYLLWAQNDPDLVAQNTNIYISAMSNPWTLSGPQVMLSKSDYEWEKIGYAVNEGPAVLKRSGRIFVSYSASATDANYAVGLLWASEDADFLNPASWHKSAEPVLKSGNNVFGPGHSMFTTSPDGTLDLLVYHGRDYEFIDGDPLNNPDRHTRVQQIFWDSDGMPIIGPPVANGTITISTDNLNQ